MSKLSKNIEKAQKNVDKTQKKINKIMVKFQIESREANEKIAKGFKGKPYNSVWRKHLYLRLDNLYKTLYKQLACRQTLHYAKSGYLWSSALLDCQ